MGPSQIRDTPFQGSVIVCFKYLHLAIPKLDVDFCELYICRFVAVSCKQYPKLTIHHYCSNMC